MTFKETAHVYLLKTSMAHKRNQIPLLNLLADYIFARSLKPNVALKG